jgi:hypothetical protein
LVYSQGKKLGLDWGWLEPVAFVMLSYNSSSKDLPSLIYYWYFSNALMNNRFLAFNVINFDLKHRQIVYTSNIFGVICSGIVDQGKLMMIKSDLWVFSEKSHNNVTSSSSDF